MMPIYEFKCHPCDYVIEEIRKLGDYDPAVCMNCSSEMPRVPSASTMHVWDTSRPFPNLTQHGDGTMKFGSKTDYKDYLKANNVGESSHDAPVKTPHGATVTVYE